MFYRHVRQSILTGVLLGIGIAVIFWAGYFFNDWIERNYLNPDLGAGANEFELLHETQSQLNQRFLKEMPTTTIQQYAAIRGMLAALNDPYTFFIEPPVAKSESDVLAGVYGGIGVQTVRNQASEILLFPYSDSPAMHAGIMDGDVLLQVDELEVDSRIPIDQLDQMLRGEVKDGNGVKITVVRYSAASGSRMERVFVPFEVISVPSVIWRVLPDSSQVGFIQITLFTNRTPEEFKQAVDGLSANGVTSLVLDLRNNSGGLLQESIKVASCLLPNSSVIAYERTRTDDHALSSECEWGGITDIPLTVLINRQTASAAEIVAAAIQDYQRGILIGSVTFGKGSVQQIVQLSDQSALHITFAEWLSPNHRHIDGVGLVPDIAVENPHNLFDPEIDAGQRYLNERTEEAVQ